MVHPPPRVAIARDHLFVASISILGRIGGINTANNPVSWTPRAWVRVEKRLVKQESATSGFHIAF